MRQPVAFALALALGALAAITLASCGGGEDAKLLPGNTAQEISENLDSVKQFAGEGECVGAENAAQEVSAQVEGLAGVDEKLKQALQRGSEKLDEVVAGCQETETEAVTPTDEAPSTEEEEEEDELPPGLEKKAEKEQEKEEKALEKEEEKQEKEQEKEEEKEVPPVTPTETTPAEPPPSESGGTGASGGVGPGAPVGGEE